MSQLLISNARIFNPGGSPAYIEDGYILIDGETIKEVGSGRPESVQGQDHEIDLQHKTVLPGMINAHTHLYSTLALGMSPPDKVPRNFVEKLKAIWWKLDLALDEDSTAASFEAGLVAALRSGVTTIIDHHSSQNFIPGSTGLLVETAQRLGVNISPAFEITDRNGRRRFEAALRENLDTFTKYHDVPGVHPTIGLHASFTLSDESLAAIRKALEELDDWGVHIHVAEDQADQVDAMEKGYPSVVQRLQAHGLMNDRSLFIHGLHITSEDLPILKEAGVAIVHNPTSNANNRVGILPDPVYRTLEVGLGTDGMQADMLAEAKEGTLIRSSQLPGGTPNVNYAALLFEKNPAIASRLFGCKLGLISPGHRADLAVYNYHPVTEISAANIYSHIIFGLEKPTDVLTRGEFRIRDNRLVDISEEEVCTRAQFESARLWKKMQEL